MIAAFLATLLFAVSTIFGYRSSRQIGGAEANLWRVCLAALFLGIWANTFGSGLAGDAFPLFLLSGFRLVVSEVRTATQIEAVRVWVGSGVTARQEARSLGKRRIDRRLEVVAGEVLVGERIVHPGVNNLRRVRIGREIQRAAEGIAASRAVIPVVCARQIGSASCRERG